MDSDSQDAVVAAVKSFLDAMLSTYLVVRPPTEAGGMGDAPGDEALLAGSGEPKSEEVARRFCFSLFVLHHVTCLGEAFKTICLEQYVL